MKNISMMEASAECADEHEMKPIERPVPSIAYIVARSTPGCVIGCENELPWKLKTDMRFFRSVTEHHAIIMGRKTLQSLGRPLPNRVNIVISTSPGENTKDIIWANSPETALYIADFVSIMKGLGQTIVIGGAQIYQIFRSQFTKIYLTEVLHDFDCGDAFFKEKFDLREWNIIDKKSYSASEIDEFDFNISIMERRLKFTRHRKLQDFFMKEELDKLRIDFRKFTEKFKKPIDTSRDQISLPLKVA